jgi:hypothetical protein
LSAVLALALAAALAASAPGASAQDLEPPDTCPDVLLSTEVVEGIFQGFECADYCHLGVQGADGEGRQFFASGEVQDFEAPYGAKVRVTVEKRQMYFWEGGCLEAEVAMAIESLD